MREVCQLVLVSAVLLTGCVHPARTAYSREYRCPVEPTRIRNLPGRRVAVTGCVGERFYDCSSNACIPERDALAPQKSAPPAPATPTARAASTDIMKAEIRPLTNGFRVLAGAAPAINKNQVVMQFHISRYRFSSPPKSCDIRLLLNLQRIALDEPVRKDDGTTYVWELKLPIETAVAIAKADVATFRLCGSEWDMLPRERETLAGLLVRFRKANAWNESPRQVGSLAREPEGGWPTWSRAAPQRPDNGKGTTMDAVALYERTRKSVYAVHVTTASAGALGSAVAITDSLLLTNCHVVQGAKTIVVGDEKQDARAKIVKADPKTDRCVLEVLNTKLNPIGGVRAHNELKVGERAYTVGAPEGFESTLGEGLVSGLREEKGLHYVQTTAPISPGSSGGGLFDAQGNLIGITTLIYVGEDKVAQSLNFAIAAEEFFTD